MYNWDITVSFTERDFYVFSKLGKLQSMRVELLFHQFGIHRIDSDSGVGLITVGHSREYAMTLFALKYTERYGILDYKMI